MSTCTVITDDGCGARLVVGIPVPVGAGEANTLVDAGQNAHESMVADPSKVAEALQVRGLRAGDGITIIANATDEVLEIVNAAGSNPGDVVGPASSTANAAVQFDGTTGKLIKDPDAAYDMGGQEITNVGDVDGRDVSADGAAADAHIVNTSNPHSTTAVQVGADPTGSAAAVQANLTAHETDVINPHLTTAALVGADPIGTASAEVSSHQSIYNHANLPTSAQKAALAGTGTPAGGNPYVNDDDSRLSDSRAPTGSASGDLAGTYPSPTIPHILSISNPHSVTAAQVGAIPTAQKGAANGVAQLDASTTVPVAQLPDRAKSRVFLPANATARLALSALEGDEAEQQDDNSQWLYDGSSWIQRALAGGDVAGPGSAGDNEIVAFDGTTGKVIQRPNAPLSANGQSIISVNLVDGRDLSVDGAKLDGIEAAAKDDQTISAGVGLTGGGTGDVSLAADFGSASGKVTQGNDSRILTQAENDAAQGTSGSPSAANRFVTNSDSRMSNARSPTSHATTHRHGGGDEVAQTAAAANAIPKALGGGTLAAGWVNDTAHGNRGGGALHADATGSVDGFMSAADKTKLDGVDAGAAVNQNVVAGTGLSGGGSGDTVNLAANIGTGVGQVAAGNDTRFPTQDQNDALDGTDGTPDAANPYVTDSDSRLSDSRTPTGTAGGQLAGTYPNPTVQGIQESGGQQLDIGAVADGEVLTRSGTDIIGTTPITSDELVKASVADTTPGRLTNKLIDGIGLTKSILNPGANEQVNLAVDYGSASGTACEGNDARLSDSRAPTGAAGGDLTGSTYPNPTIAANAVTNAKMAIMAANTIKARAGSSPDVPGDLVIANGNIPIRPAGANLQSGTPAQVRTLINVEDGATNTPLTSATPADVTDSTGSVGTGTDVARDDHAHAHGNRGGGSLHAVATTLVAGFMSAADKTNLDTITPGNFFPVKQAGATNLIYVRTTGNDTTGDGTLSTPYRTIARALEDVPFMIYGETYVIECTGLGQELVTTPLVFPPIYSPDAAVFGSTRVAGFTITRSVTIEAAPTLVDTIAALELTGQTSNSTTNLKTLQTTKNYTLDQHRGKLVRDANNLVAVIASNTAGPNSDIEVTAQTALVAPVEILDQSAEIRNSDAGGSGALELRNLMAGVQLNGIKLTTANPSSFRYGLFLDNHVGAFGTSGCYLDGYFVALGIVQPSIAGTYVTKRYAATGVCSNLFSCFVDDATVALRNSGLSTDVSFWFENIFDGCSPLGAGTGIEDINSIAVSMDRCEVRNSTGDGVQVVPGGRFVVRRSELNNNAGNGMAVRGSGLSVLRDSQGTGNTGLGLQLANGAVVQRVGASAPTGTGGDYQVGGNTAGTWGGFSGDENDLGATTPQICRLYV